VQAGDDRNIFLSTLPATRRDRHIALGVVIVSAIFFGVTGIQLFGEEVFSILPFLALLWLLHTRFGFERKPAIVCAWVGCAIWFGAAHLPTYHWNFIQCFAVIGLARIVLLLAYLKTKNILVSFGAHLLTDWGIFVFALASAAFGGKVP